MEPFELEGCEIRQVSIDSRSCGPNSLFVALRGSQTDGHQFVPEAAANGATLALVESNYQPSYPLGCQLIRVADPLRALQAIAATYRRQRPATVVAITGSRGKTLLKELLRQLLEPYLQAVTSPDSFNSQLGVALSLLQIEDRHQVALIEAGISKPGEMARLAEMIQPDAAIFTGLGSAHLASLGGPEAQSAEKRLLLDAARHWLVRPDQESWVRCLSNDYTSRLVYQVQFPDGSQAEGCLTKGLGFGLELIDLAVRAAWNLGLTASQIGAMLPRLRLEPLDVQIAMADGITLVAAPAAQTRLSMEKTLRRLPAAGRNGRQLMDLPDDLRQGDVLLATGTRLDQLQRRLYGCAPHSQLQIRLSAIEANLEQVRLQLPGTRIMAMVKAAGYGTDGSLLAKSLSRMGVDIVGVAYVHEAVALRRAGVTQSIFVLYAAPEEASICAEEDLEVAVSDPRLIEALYQAAGQRTIRCHLHVDTGMTRLGCRLAEALSLAQRIQAAPQLQLEGLMTHLATADDPNQDAFTRSQIDRFETVRLQLAAEGLLPRWVHAANSAAAMRQQLPHCNMVRLGMGMLGMADWGQPAACLISSLAAIHQCQPGDTISYGRTYTVDRQERIGVVPLGYFDGLHRHYSGRAHLMVRGKPAPLAGTICMDFLMVSLKEIPEACVGDRVVLFGTDDNGQSASPSQLATQGQTSVYELLACLGPRVQRVFIDDL
jgi:alanine racemase